MYAGGSGGTPTSNTYGGSGGGSGGTGSAGNSGSATSGIGAAAVTGGGNGGDANTSSGSGPGQTPTIPPGGGGGGARCANDSNPGFTGGDGAVGKVILIYTVKIAPSVSLTAPTNGASYAGPASITMTADALAVTGTITTVSFYSGTNLLGSDTSAPYACTWTNVAPGSYNLTARATDNGGAVGVSAVVAIRVLDPTYALTVNSGSGSGSYLYGQQVAISATAPAAGKVFSQWTGDIQYVNNATYTNALVTMSTNPVTLTATYVDAYYALTVNNGTGGGGTYTNGTQVAISADAPAAGKVFSQWTGDSGYVANSNSASTTVTMPAQAVTLSATYADVYYALTVNSGSGDGSYTNGTQVAISADAVIGKAFVQWTGDTQYVNNVTYTNALVTLSTNAVTLSATYVDVYYTLTVNSGTGDGSYTNGRQVAISADAPAPGKVFSQWTGDTQVVNNVTYTNALVTMSTNAVTLSATYVDVYYDLTVTSGTGSGSYTNTQVVEISADAPAEGMVFDQWTGDTQGVASVTASNTMVAMPATNVSLSATYKNLPGYYTLTVSNGTGGGIYSNGVQVTVEAVAPEGTAFDRWTGDVQVVAGVFSLSTIVTMPAQDAALSASCVDVSNGVANVNWQGSSGFYFDADPYMGILGDGTGNKTYTQLMYSPDNVKDSILPSGAGAVNDVVWSQITISEDGIPGDANYDSYAWFIQKNCTRAFTNGYVYALIFQDNNVQAGDWYYSTPLVAVSTNAGSQSIEMNVDLVWGDPIDGPNGAQVVDEQVVEEFVLTSSAGANGTVSPASTNVLAGNSATFEVTADSYYRIATLETNGTAITGMTFDNNSTATNFIWSNVQTSGVLSATFTAQVTTNAPADVPYEWLAEYGLTNSGATFNEAADADTDADGLSAWQEYIAGTDPTNDTSCLKVTQNTRDTIIWDAVSGRIYSVYWSTNLMSGFQPLEMNIPYPRNSYTNADPDSRVNHYQIKVRMP